MNTELVRMFESGETIEAFEVGSSKENIPRYRSNEGWISGRVLVDKVLGQSTLLLLKEPAPVSSSPGNGAKKLLNTNLKDKMMSVSTNWFNTAKSLTSTKVYKSNTYNIK